MKGEGGGGRGGVDGGMAVVGWGGVERIIQKSYTISTGKILHRNQEIDYVDHEGQRSLNGWRKPRVMLDQLRDRASIYDDNKRVSDDTQRSRKLIDSLRLRIVRMQTRLAASLGDREEISRAERVWSLK